MFSCYQVLAMSMMSQGFSQRPVFGNYSWILWLKTLININPDKKQAKSKDFINFWLTPGQVYKRNPRVSARKLLLWAPGARASENGVRQARLAEAEIFKWMNEKNILGFKFCTEAEKIFRRLAWGFTLSLIWHVWGPLSCTNPDLSPSIL